MARIMPLEFDPRQGHGASRPAGTLLVAALVCLLAVMLLGSVLVRTVTQRHRQLRWDEWQLQCLYLLESAVSRAAARSGTEPDYRGEIWTVSLDDHGTVRAGVVTIRVEPVAGQSQRRLLHLEAHWPDDPVDRIQRRQDVIIAIPNSGAGS